MDDQKSIFGSSDLYAAQVESQTNTRPVRPFPGGRASSPPAPSWPDSVMNDESKIGPPHDLSSVPQASTVPPLHLHAPIRTDPRCSKCRQLQAIPQPITSGAYHHSYRNLKISAARGCTLCQFFYKEIAAQSKVQNMTRQLSFSYSSGKLTAFDYTSTSLNFEVFLIDAHITLSFDSGSSLSTDIPIDYRSIASHANSDQSWALIENWLSKCTLNHPNCTSLHREQRLPTRLIDVNVLRLAETKNLTNTDQNMGFTTLSHSWGSVPMASTTKARYQAYLGGIDKDNLPSTFQDAITVTRRLQIPYLWIDALCIVQDDAEDWSIEAGRMGSYYRDCFLNISALGAFDSNAGFLHRRPPQPVAQLQHGLQLRPAQPTWREIFQDSPLSQRAWVLQERLVSPRILHFGTSELFWECSTLSERESSRVQHNSRGGSSEWVDEDFKRALQFASTDAEEIMGSWYKVVSLYTSLHLTFSQDIFPAISAIAKVVEEASGFRYVDGLWLEHLHSGLLWYRVYLGRKDLTGHSKSSSWRAPSWSWASLEGPVNQLYGSSSAAVDTILKANIVKAGPCVVRFDKLGEINRSCIVLDAICLEVWCKTSYAAPPFNDPYLALIVDIFHEDGIMIGTGYRDPSQPDGDLIKSSNFEELQHALAVVISQRHDPQVGRNENITFFLLVRPIPGSNPPSYERIGIGQTADSHNNTIIRANAFDDALLRKIRLL